MKEFKTTYDGMTTNSPVVEERPLQCDHYVNRTVFWIQRWDATNAFHFMEDVITTFESLLAFGIAPEEVQIAIVDGMESKNSLAQFWTNFFGFPARVVARDPFPPNTCFARSIFNMHAGISHLSMNGGVSKNTGCYPSAILFALRAFVKPRLREWLVNNSKLVPSSPNTSNTAYPRTIVFVSRRSPHSRVIPNEAALISWLQSRLNATRWRIVVYIPETINTIEEQIASVAFADVIIGVHGAALAYATFMDPGRHMIEIFHSSRNVENRHYYNLCHWAGVKYSSGGFYTGAVDAETLWSRLVPAIEDIERQLALSCFD
jgi:hypothetical protein